MLTRDVEKTGRYAFDSDRHYTCEKDFMALEGEIYQEGCIHEIVTKDYPFYGRHSVLFRINLNLKDYVLMRTQFQWKMVELLGSNFTGHLSAILNHRA